MNPLSTGGLNKTGTGTPNSHTRVARHALVLGSSGNVQSDSTVSAQPGISTIQPDPTQEPVKPEPTCHACHVLVATDNTTVVANINKEGGMKSGSLCALLWRTLSWCCRKQVTLKARHIPGQLNAIADKSGISTLQPDPAQEPVKPEPTCLAPRATAFKEQGFSEAVAAQIEAPQRGSTISVRGKVYHFYKVVPQ